MHTLHFVACLPLSMGRYLLPGPGAHAALMRRPGGCGDSSSLPRRAAGFDPSRLPVREEHHENKELLQMNRIRRKALNELMDKLAELKDELESLRDEEQEAFDAIPESFEGTDRYTQAEEAVNNLYAAFGSLEECIDSITEAIGE